MKHECDDDTNCNWSACNDPQSFQKRAGRVGNQRTSRDHPNYSIVDIGWNTEKNPAVTLVNDYKLMLVWKTRKELIITKVIEEDTIKLTEIFKKEKKRVSQRNKKTSWKQTLEQKSHLRNKYLDSPATKIL